MKRSLRETALNEKQEQSRLLLYLAASVATKRCVVAKMYFKAESKTKHISVTVTMRKSSYTKSSQAIIQES